jgi:hypothetical protein
MPLRVAMDYAWMGGIGARSVFVRRRHRSGGAVVEPPVAITCAAQRIRATHGLQVRRAALHV